MRPGTCGAVLLLVAAFTLGACSLEVDHTRAPITIGETSVLGDTDPNNGDVLVADRVVLDQAATLQGLSVHVKRVESPAGFLTLAVFGSARSGTEPGDLIAATDPVPAVLGWNSAPVTSPVLLPAGTYWLVVTFSLDTIVPAYSASSGTEYWADWTYGTLPATYPSDSYTATGHYSLYATLQP